MVPIERDQHIERDFGILIMGEGLIVGENWLDC